MQGTQRERANARVHRTWHAEQCGACCGGNRERYKRRESIPPVAVSVRVRLRPPGMVTTQQWPDRGNGGRNVQASSGRGSGGEDTDGVNGGARTKRYQGRRDGCARRRRKECELGVRTTVTARPAQLEVLCHIVPTGNQATPLTQAVNARPPTLSQHPPCTGGGQKALPERHPGDPPHTRCGRRPSPSTIHARVADSLLQSPFDGQARQALSLGLVSQIVRRRGSLDGGRQRDRGAARPVIACRI